MKPENIDAFLAFYLTTEREAGWVLLERYGLAALALLMFIAVLFVGARKLGGVSTQIGCIACGLAIICVFGFNVSSGAYDVWLSTFQTQATLEAKASICQYGCYLNTPTLSTSVLSMKAETVSEIPADMSEVDVLYAYHNALISQSSGNSGFVLLRYVETVDGYGAEIAMPMRFGGSERTVILRIPADIVLYAIPLSATGQQQVQLFVKAHPAQIKSELHPVALQHANTELY